MESVYITVTVRLLVSMAAGGLIGFERRLHGRPAGLRTHILVCSASTLLILLSTFQWDVTTGVPIENVSFDPMRTAQGIMTGIGFLGAGVIIKEKTTVLGLTTAATIWITAALGIIIGAGFYFAAALAAAIILTTLVLFRWLEDRFPTEHFATLAVRSKRDRQLDQQELERVVCEHDMRIVSTNFSLSDHGEIFTSLFVVKTSHKRNFNTIARTLSDNPSVHEFDLTLTSR